MCKGALGLACGWQRKGESVSNSSLLAGMAFMAALWEGARMFFAVMPK